MSFDPTGKSYTVHEICKIGTKGNDFGCIYIIKNIKNGKCYVGQTYNFFKRSRGHIILSIQQRGLHIDKEMSKDPSSFLFTVIETYEDIGVTFKNRRIRTVREHHYINKFKTYFPHGYNIARYESIQP